MLVDEGVSLLATSVISPSVYLRIPPPTQADLHIEQLANDATKTVLADVKFGTFYFTDHLSISSSTRERLRFLLAVPLVDECPGLVDILLAQDWLY